MTSLTDEFAATDPVVGEEETTAQVNDAPVVEDASPEEQADPSVTPDEQLNLDDPHDVEAARQAAFERGAQVIADTQGREATARDNAIIGAAFDQAVETAGEQKAVWGMDFFMGIFQQFFGAIMGNDGSMEGLDFGNLFGGLFGSSEEHDHGDRPAITGSASFVEGGRRVAIEHPLRDYRGGIGHDVGYVARRGRVHEGRDYAISEGTDIYAAAEGQVIDVIRVPAGTDSGYGNQIVIQHPNGIVTRYAHLKDGSINVGVGDQVSTDTVIAEVGSTGGSTGPHLHFEVGVRDGNGAWKIIDPEDAFRAGQGINDFAERAQLIGETAASYGTSVASNGFNGGARLGLS
tara:strand:+ start:15783 stop:16823 length:1041 start_codon:yes stop_codon:yes gene_type:complete